MTNHDRAREALGHFVDWSARADLDAIEIGLLNETFRVTSPKGERYILQRVNPMFGAEVHHDIEAVTARLESRGLTTPRLLRTGAGELFAVASDEACWRVMTYIPGNVQKTANADTLRTCGSLVARFHEALFDLDHEFRFVRPGAHDTPKHLATLADARESDVRGSEENEPTLDEVHRLADAVLLAGRDLQNLQDVTPARVIHGDLKLTNIMLRDAEAVAVLDLDTMSRGALAVELGDALRSWCNALGENEGVAELDQERFAAAIAGYGEHARITSEERETIVLGLLTISTELAARFCADAYRESYFGWDRARFVSSRAHNVTRAKVQLSLAAQVTENRSALEALVAGSLSP